MMIDVDHIVFKLPENFDWQDRGARIALFHDMATKLAHTMFQNGEEFATGLTMFVVSNVSANETISREQAKKTYQAFADMCLESFDAQVMAAAEVKAENDLNYRPTQAS